MYEECSPVFHRVKMEINRSFVNEVVQYIKRVREPDRQSGGESERERERASESGRECLDS